MNIRILCFTMAAVSLKTESASVQPLNVTCSPDFYLENSTCFPICQQWKQFSDSVSALVQILITAASLLGILGGGAVIVGSAIRYKSM